MRLWVILSFCTACCITTEAAHARYVRAAGVLTTVPPDVSLSSIPDVSPSSIVDHGTEPGGIGKIVICPALDPNDDLCDLQDEPSITEFGMTNETARTIVEWHNVGRTYNLVWDDFLSKRAQKLAQSILPDPDNDDGEVKYYLLRNTGKNKCKGYSTPAKCIADWNENTMPITQPDALTIGCGYAFVSEKPLHERLVCIYGYEEVYDSGADEIQEINNCICEA